MLFIYLFFGWCLQIGNWSRWLSDLFGIEDSESLEDSDTAGDDKGSESFKAFRFLNALSDLMMLPLEMLMDIPTRKEVNGCYSKLV